MKKGTFTFAFILLLSLFVTSLYSNPELTDVNLRNRQPGTSQGTIEVQRNIDGGEWSKCDAKLSGPNILCVDARGMFQANISDAIPEGCDSKAKDVKWKTDFSKNELTLFNKQGQEFQPGQPVKGNKVFVRVETGQPRTKDIIATHPCCGKAKYSLTLNGLKDKVRRTTTIPNVNPNVSAKQFEDQVDSVLGDSYKVTDEDVQEVINFIHFLLKTGDYVLPDNYLTGDVSEKLRDDLPLLEFKLHQASDEYNEAVEEAISETTKKIESAINGISPNVRISGEYHYRPCSCDPAQTGLGWKNEKATVTGPTNIHVDGGVVFNNTFSVGLFGNTITIPAGAEADVKLSLDKFSASEVTAHNPEKPKTKVSAQPFVETSASGSASGGFGVTLKVGGGIGLKAPIHNRVVGTLEYNCPSLSN